MSKRAHNLWPTLKSYRGEYLRRIAMPIGGIGTGTVSLGGRGDLRDWEIMNQPAKGFTPVTRVQAGLQRHGPFFAIYVQPKHGPSITRALEGPLPIDVYEGSHGASVANHGLSRFAKCSFDAAYPLAQVHLRDPKVPVHVTLQAMNPLIPGDTQASSLPVAVLRYALTNTTNQPLQVAVCGNVPNFVGVDPAVQRTGFCGQLEPVGGEGNVNHYRETSLLRGLSLEAPTLDPASPHAGTIALATTAGEGVSHRAAWSNLYWGAGVLNFWEDFAADGILDPIPRNNDPRPMASLAVKFALPAKATRHVTFFITWHFPNRRDWNNRQTIGNHYCTQFSDAWNAAEKIAAQLDDLEQRTVSFVREFCEADLPTVAKEAALFNASTLRSQTCFRTPDGKLFGWEGTGDTAGCCAGSCTHVWNYEHTLSYLFGDLSRTMREVEFRHATSNEGRMAFRMSLPLLPQEEHFKGAAADGQMGTITRLYRDWQLCGDDAFLNKLWPHAKAAMQFCWLPGSWDGDRDGVMEGCQHNTMDVEYHGPNPQMTGWYLAALCACERMANHLGDHAFAATCRDLFTRGSAWMDEHLFNGEYYEHQIIAPANPDAIHPSLLVGMGAEDARNPSLQLGAGCLVDQLVGQTMAHVCGLGHLHNISKIQTTLRHIVRHNTRSGFADTFNNMRSYAMGDERGLVMASYPRGNRPQRPFPYFNEVMTGFEYTAAIHMLYEGRIKAGLRVIADIRDRYDGRKRNPFDEAECGHHYARAMAAWGAVLALTGFHFSAVDQTLTFNAAKRKTKWFWSAGSAWGTCEQSPSSRRIQLKLRVMQGKLTLRTITLNNFGDKSLAGPRTIHAGESMSIAVKMQA